MTAAARQASYRKRVKDEGMVDIRLEIPETVRDRVRAVARARNSTMKAEMRKAIEELSRSSSL